MYVVTLLYATVNQTLTMHDKARAEALFNTAREGKDRDKLLFASLYGPDGLIAMTDARPPEGAKDIKY